MTDGAALMMMGTKKFFQLFFHTLRLALHFVNVVVVW